MLVTCMLVAGGLLAEAKAQTGVVEGTVTEDGSSRGVPGVQVYLENDARGSVTDGSGAFRISDVPAGEHTLVARMLGYETITQTITVEVDETITLSLRISEQPVEISEVLVERTRMTGGRRGIDEIPGSAAYLGPRELQRQSHSDINRVLRSVPGVYLQEEDGYGLRPNIGLRGTGLSRSNKISMMEDGVLIAPAPYSAPAAYFVPTMGRMHSVEVRKGSSQVKYGPYTTGGAINFVSMPIPSDFRGYAEVLGGPERSRRLHAHAGDSYQHVGFLVQTFQEGTDGFKNLDSGGDTGFYKGDYLAKLRFHTSPGAALYQSLTLKAGYVTERSDETYLGLTDHDFSASPFRRYAGSQVDVMEADQRQFSAQHLIQPAPFLDVTTTVYRTAFARNWYKLDRVRTDDAEDFISIGAVLEDPSTFASEYAVLTGQSSATEQALEVKHNNREYYAQGVQSIVGIHFDAAGLEHDLEVGLRYHVDEVDRFQWIDLYRMDGGVMQQTFSGTPGTESNRIQNARAWAGYVQYQMTAGRFFVTPGVRHERITMRRYDYGTEDPADLERRTAPIAEQENEVNVWLPGVGLDYAWTDALSSFVGIHRGFAPPGPSPDTRPEESLNYELGVRYRIHGLRAQAVVFFNDYANLLGADLTAGGGDGTLRQFNGGAVRVSGAELSVDYDLAPLAGTSVSLPFNLAYTFTDTAFKNDFESDFGPWGHVAAGDELPYIPRHQLAAGLGVQGPRLQVHLQTNAVGAVRTIAGRGSLHSGQSLPAYVVLDASAEFAATRYLALFGSIRNVTDAVYAVARRPAGLRPGLPRTALVGIRVTL